jgi:aspartyl protease family protein
MKNSGSAGCGPDGLVIGWAVRWVLLCCGATLLTIGLFDRGAVMRDRATQPGSSAGLAVSVEHQASSSSNRIVYPADDRGQIILHAAVNGTPVRMLLDTGASLVTLTPADARAAGIRPAELAYSSRISTANGVARMAPVTLREIRIDQLSVFDVPAAVVEKLDISLLGMSFLSRLEGYEMREGKLTISW